MGFKKPDPAVIQKITIRKDSSSASQTVQIEKQFFKAGIGQTFSSGQACTYHSCFPGLMHQILPYFNRKNRLTLQLISIEMYVTHLAVEIAQRSQFKLSGYRNTLIPGLKAKITFHLPVALMLLPVFLSKLFYKIKSIYLIHTFDPFSTERRPKRQTGISK